MIRSARVGDAADVTAIYVESWNLWFGELQGSRSLTDERVAQWRRHLAAAPPQRWWVAEVDGSVAGFAGICPSRDPVEPALGELDTIAVRRDRWRMGIGRSLMATALRQLAADGYEAAVLWTLRDFQRSRAFYEATGWRRDGGSRDDGRQVSYRHPLRSPTGGPA